MTARPLLLDLYCCSGGAGEGYRRAGFDVIGVDLVRPTAYPAGEFHQCDALAVLTALVAFGTWRGHRPDAVHASPPCQTHSALTKGNRRRDGWQDRHVDLVAATRETLDRTGLPYVIENVQGAPVRRDLTLCGEMFGLAVIRHRYFELGGGWSMEQPAHVPHRGRVAGMRHGEWFTGPYFAVYGEGGGKGTVAQWQAAMGIDWTTDRRELAEAIPPAYTELVGRGLLAALELEAAA